MPIHKVSGGYKWGGHGATYPTKAGAEKQAAAAYAHGYTGDDASDMQMAIQSLSEELQAIRVYMERIDACQGAALCEVLKHNMGEEEEHARRLLKWIGAQVLATDATAHDPKTGQFTTGGGGSLGGGQTKVKHHPKTGNPMEARHKGKTYHSSGKVGKSFGNPGTAPKDTEMHEMKSYHPETGSEVGRIWVSKNGKHIVEDSGITNDICLPSMVVR